MNRIILDKLKPHGGAKVVIPSTMMNEKEIVYQKYEFGMYGIAEESA
jgi:hypothetical protein